jgi:hypothetical protein
VGSALKRAHPVKFGDADWSVMLTLLPHRNGVEQQATIANMYFGVEAAGLTLDASVQCFIRTRYGPG